VCVWGGGGYVDLSTQCIEVGVK